MITPEVLGRALGEAANPEQARVAIARLGERPLAREELERPEVLVPATRLLGFSSAAADFYLARPEELASLAEVRVRTTEELRTEATDAIRLHGPEAGLRRFRRRAAYRTAARDLGGATVDEVMAELTAIAEAALTAALATVQEGEGFAVIAMGKLGGSELNYASDVDVLFVHAEPGIEGQDHASEAAAGLIRLLSEPSEDGVALRVDADLRPDGRSGPLSRSLQAMAEYYEHHAETWERQALLKARPVAGDLALGHRLLTELEPVVYPIALSPSAIEDVRSTKVRIEEHVRALGKDATEVKRGRGGIRDVEFAVQLLQLVHGRRDKGLRDPSTLGALSALADHGYVAVEDAAILADSYRFLRRLEHRLQMVRDLQTHELPTDPRALGPLARSLGLWDGAELLREYHRHTELVRTLHERLFYRPLLEAFAGPHAARPGRPGSDPEAAHELLAGLGFIDPAAASRAFTRIMDPSSRLGQVMGAQFPVIAPELALSAQPDAAAVRFERVAEALRPHASLAERLAGRPDAARRLAAVVAASSRFADALVAQPATAGAVFDLPAPERPLFPEPSTTALLRVAAAFAAHDVTVPDLGRCLTAVADGVLAETLAAEAPPGVPMALIGFGRLGAEELSFASDLDVMFVYDGDGPEAYEGARAAAARVVVAAQAAGWHVDADLRPEGKAGPLARSLASYLEYWERYAETWEYQALLRGRFVAGDESLGRRFVSNATDFAYPEALTVEQVVAIRRMRVRMEEERVRPREARRFHFKLGYGGVADVQFATELALMRHGFDHPEVRRTNTLEALDALATARLVEDSVVLALSEAFVFLTSVKATLELERLVPAEALPPAPEELTALARRLGYEERARHRFLQDYRRITRRARQAMERVFYGDEG